MIAKLLLICAAVAVSQATWIGSGIVAPGLLNGGLLAPGIVKAPIATAVRTGSIVAIPGAVSTDSRIIGTSGVLTGVPVLGSGLLGSGVVTNSLVANGLLRAPLGIGAPIGLKGVGIIG